MKNVLIIFMLVVVLFSGCRTAPVHLKAPLEEEGAVFLYSKPFPQEAGSLSFSLESIQAVSERGTEHVLIQSLPEFNNKVISKQRLVAAGPVPPGAYSGFSLKVKRAGLQTEEGNASLRIPDTAVRIAYPFKVQRKKALVLSMEFRYKESLSGGISFSPSFSFMIPERPLINLMGFVTNSGSHTVTVFDKRSMEVTGVIATGNSPRGMALSQGRGRVFVALSGEDVVTVIDIASGEIMNDIRLSPGDKPRELDLTSDEKTLLVANSGSDTVSIINATTFMEIERIPVGNEPRSVVIDKAGRRAFVCNTGSSTLSVIDIPAKVVVATLVTEPRPLRGQFNRNGDRFYIISERSPYLTVLDPATLAVLRREFVGLGLYSLKVDTKTDLLYIGKKFDVELAVYDPFSLAPVDYVRTKDPVEYMTIDGEINNLYLAIPEKRGVSVFNLTSRKLQADFDVGEDPYWITMHGVR